MTVQSFTPGKQYTSFSGLINEVRNQATYANAANNTYTTSDVLGGFIIRDTNGGARTDTMPTAAALVPLIQGAEVGSCIKFYIKNTAAGANTLTVAIGTGGTAVGTMTVAQSNIKKFMLRVTAVGDADGVGSTYDLISLGTSVF